MNNANSSSLELRAPCRAVQAMGRQFWRRSTLLFLYLLLLSAVPAAVPQTPHPEAAESVPAAVAPQPWQTPAALSCRCIRGVECDPCSACGPQTWKAMCPIPFEQFAQGDYVGEARSRQLPIYRLRTDDVLDVVYRLTREVSSSPYELGVGDRLRVDAFMDDKLNREVEVQPDGNITMSLIPPIRAVGRTVQQLTAALNEAYKEYYQQPIVTVTPVRINMRLRDLLDTVDARAGEGGQRIQVPVTPEGTIQLPGLGSIYVQGLSLDEAEREIDARYRELAEGIAVTPVLISRAPRFVYVLGEVSQPGRFSLEGPTTAMQALAMAGSWNVGANLRQVVVFRRADDWRLQATMLDLRGALYGRTPCPADEIWLRDSDVIVVPKTPIAIVNDIIDQVFTRGVYGVVPNFDLITGQSFATLSRAN